MHHLFSFHRLRRLRSKVVKSLKRYQRWQRKVSYIYIWHSQDVMVWPKKQCLFYSIRWRVSFPQDWWYILISLFFTVMLPLMYQCSSACNKLCAEIGEFKVRRIQYFKKHMVELVELELKHAKVSPTFSPFFTDQPLILSVCICGKLSWAVGNKN